MRKLPVVLVPLPIAVNLLMLFVATLAVVPFFASVPSLAPSADLAVVPLIPLLVAWDGTVSALRAYSPDELRPSCATFPAPRPTPGRPAWRANLYLTGEPR